MNGFWNIILTAAVSGAATGLVDCTSHSGKVDLSHCFVIATWGALVALANLYRQKPPALNGSSALKALAFSLALMPSMARAEDAQPLGKDFAFVGATANGGVRPFGGYGHQIMEHVYSFTQATATRLTRKPFNIETTVTTGLCEVRPLGEYVILGGCIEDGPTVAGTNKGNVVGGTPFVVYRFGKSHWAATVGGDLFHSSLDNSRKMQTKVFGAVVFDWNRPPAK